MTTPVFSLIQVTRDFDCPVDTLFAHWLNPETRVRWEAPPESGMRYLNFDTREDGVERLEITHEGEVVGEMIQRILVLRENEALVSSITGVFGGRITMAMQVTVGFEATDTGSRLSGTGQVVDLTGRDVEDEHSAGWNMLLDNFATDLAANPL